MGKSKTLYQPFQGLSYILNIGHWLAIIVIGLYGLFLPYDWFQNWISPYIKSGINQFEVYASIGSLLVFTFSIIVYRLGRGTDKLRASIEDFKLDFDDKLFTKGTRGIYDDVDQELTAKRHIGQKIIIDILGYTLFSVEPKIPYWKEEGKLRNMELNLHYLDMDFIKSSPYIINFWADKLKINLEGIENFILENKDYLRKNKVEINLKPYAYIPAIHGFRLGDGSIYMSFAVWNKQGMIADPGFRSSYVKLKINDKSAHAIQLKNLFNNWLEQSIESANNIEAKRRSS